MIKASTQGPKRMLKGLIIAPENRSHCMRAKTCKKMAALSEQLAFSQLASNFSRLPKLRLAVSKLAIVLLVILS